MALFAGGGRIGNEYSKENQHFLLQGMIQVDMARPGQTAGQRGGVIGGGCRGSTAGGSFEEVCPRLERVTNRRKDLLLP